MYQFGNIECKVGLLESQINDVVDMLNDLYKDDNCTVTHVGSEAIKFEYKIPSQSGPGHNIRMECLQLIWCLAYLIPKKLRLNTVIVDVNHKQGLYEYVAQRYRESKQIKEVVIMKEDNDYPDFPHDFCGC